MMRRRTNSLQCPRCGQDNSAGASFCRHCGRKLPKSAVTPAGAPKGSASRGTKSGSPKAKAAATKGRRIRWWRVAGLTAAGVVLAAIAGGGYLTLKALHNMPSVANLVALSTSGQDSVIYDRFGNKVATLHLSTNRVDVPLDKISPNVQNALVAIEDHNFWHESGFDLRGMMRAALVDVVHHSAVQGASTIPEQLAKIMYLHDNHTLTYKIREIVLGLELSRSYSRQQILDMYFNQVYLGDGAQGIETASKAYFDEKPSQLTIPQAALLAGLPQAPSAYDPLINFKAAKVRQLQVLQAMAKYGYIKPSQVQKYWKAPLHLSPTKVKSANVAAPFPYPWYIQHVIDMLEAKGFTRNEIYNGGLKIHTELDPKVYNIAQTAVDHWMNYNFGKNPTYQAATVVENPKNGAIWAVIGARSYTPFGEDFATSKLALRSSGSSIKPLLEYTEAIMQGQTQVSTIQDFPTVKVNGQWWPKNDDGIYRGYIDLRDALAISDNDAAFHLLETVGRQTAWKFLTKDFGITTVPQSDMQYGGVAIGGFHQGGVNALEMTHAYASFANNGVIMKPMWVTKVVDANGSVVYHQSPQGKRIFSKQVAFIMDQMMQRVLDPNPLPGIGPGAYATAGNLQIGRPAAGKTGTNNQEKDAWFMGYEPQMVVGVWEGNRKGEIAQPATPHGIAYGSVAAGPIWQQIMEQVNKAENIPVKNFNPPSGVVQESNISITSGQLAGSLTPKADIANNVWFIKGTQPTNVGHDWVKLKVPASNHNVLWRPGCGPAIQKVFLVPESNWQKPEPKPYDAKYWAPTKTCTPTGQPSSPSGSLSPNPSGSVGPSLPGQSPSSSPTPPPTTPAPPPSPSATQSAPPPTTSTKASKG